MVPHATEPGPTVTLSGTFDQVLLSVPAPGPSAIFPLKSKFQIKTTFDGFVANGYVLTPNTFSVNSPDLTIQIICKPIEAIIFTP